MTQILKHGYVEFIESWGSDERIIESARMSTQGGFKGWGPVHQKGCESIDQVPGSAFGGPCTCDGPGPGDEKLLRFLYCHKHSTPFEFGGMTIQVQAPISVFREWHRHRTQCLVGSTEISLVSPRGTSYKRTIKEIYDRKYGMPISEAPSFHENGFSKKLGRKMRIRPRRRKDPNRYKPMKTCQARTMRVLDETTGRFTTGRMVDVWKSGIKEVFSVITEYGSVTASENHPFLTKLGWKQLKNLRPGDEIARLGMTAVGSPPIPKMLRSGIGLWTTRMRSRIIDGPTGYCYVCATHLPANQLQLDHVVPVSVDISPALSERNLKPICGKCHREKTRGEQPVGRRSGRGVRWEIVSSIELAGSEMTYDISVEAPNHNYVANDFVVHNSYSEASARYGPLPDLHYLPTVERCLMVNEANKQANKIAGAPTPSDREVSEWLDNLSLLYEMSQHVYARGLAIGIPKEVARFSNVVARFSTMRATANLRNWIGFITLRDAPDAQYEIRVYAEQVVKILKKRFPRTMEIVGEVRGR